MARACQASLSRLGTSFLDLYLLHWPVPNSQFSDVVEGFEQLRAAGKIKTWGVSNLTVTRWKISSVSPTAIAVRPLAGGINNKGSAHTAVSLGSAKPLTFTGWNDPLLYAWTVLCQRLPPRRHIEATCGSSSVWSGGAPSLRWNSKGQ
jgi:hypothetical protein